MRRHSLVVGIMCAALSLSVAAGCAKKEAPPAQSAPVATAKVTEVNLGTAVNTAQQVDAPTVVFKPSDTIYAAVKTEDTPAGTRILARWVYTEGGAETVVSEDELVTNAAGTGYTSFHIKNPAPWPAGRYQLRVGLNGDIKETKEFTVGG